MFCINTTNKKGLGYVTVDPKKFLYLHPQPILTMRGKITTMDLRLLREGANMDEAARQTGQPLLDRSDAAKIVVARQQIQPLLNQIDFEKRVATSLFFIASLKLISGFSKIIFITYFTLST